MDVTPELRAHVYFHAGLPDADRVSSILGVWRISLGAVFTIDKGLEFLRETSRPYLMMTLARLDNIDQQIGNLPQFAMASRVGDMVIREDAYDVLADLYQDQQGQLAKLLGVSEMQFAILRRGAKGGSRGRLNGRWSS